MVSRGPVNAVALWTPRVIFLRRKDVGRNNLFYRCLGPGLEHEVTFQTALKRIVERTQTAGFDHLAQLLAVMVALDEKKIGRLLSLESAIPGQDQSILRARGADQAIA